MGLGLRLATGEVAARDSTMATLRWYSVAMDTRTRCRTAREARVRERRGKLECMNGEADSF
jgi:hypothetical protein